MLFRLLVHIRIDLMSFLVEIRFPVLFIFMKEIFPP